MKYWTFLSIDKKNPGYAFLSLDQIGYQNGGTKGGVRIVQKMEGKPPYWWRISPVKTNWKGYRDGGRNVTLSVEFEFWYYVFIY